MKHHWSSPRHDSPHVKARGWLILFLILALGALLVACADDTTQDKANVDQVEVNRARGNPPQYTAIVSGFLPDACTRIGRISQRVSRTTIMVTMYTRRPGDAMCAAVLAPFEENVPLDVDGLSAGSYSVDVNGVVTSFTLTEDH
jgi:inhibitor of cysteine peptidase